jgi:hypothetical protein
MPPMPQFKPSKASLTPKRKALLSLGYAKAAITQLEVFLQDTEEGEVPAWVLTKINQGASTLGQAVSFVTFKASKKEKP